MLGKRQKQAAFIGLITTVVYVFIAGAGIPVQRAGWMAGAGFLALLMERERHSLNTFFMAFFILILLDARVIYQISFQLSFLSVFCLILFYKNQEVWMHRVDSLLQSLMVLLGTFPLVLYYFNLFSPISLLANLGAVPLMHLGLLSAMAALLTSSIPFLGTVWTELAQFFGWASLAWIQGFARFDWGYLYFPSPSSLNLFIYYATALALVGLHSHSGKAKLFGPWRIPVKLTLMGLWLALGFSFLRPDKSSSLQLTMFAAGQNEIFSLSEGREGEWLLHAGRGKPSNQAQWIVGPYLKSRGIKRLKGVILTDSLRRHSGGMEFLARNFKWNYLIAPSEEIWPLKRGPLADSRISPIFFRKGLAWALGRNINLTVLEQKKNHSVFHLDFQGIGVLWMSELQKISFENLDFPNEKRLAVEIILLSSQAQRELKNKFDGFLNHWDPSIIAAPVLDEGLKEALRERDILYLSPDSYGALRFEFDLKRVGEKKNPVQIYSFLEEEILPLRI